MVKKIVSVIRFLFQKVVGFSFNLLIPRCNKYIAVGCCVNDLDMFMHNTKYFFLHLNNNYSNYKCIWLTNNETIIKKLQSNGYKNVYKKTSFRGIWYALRAKYWLYDYNPTSVSNKILCYGAVLINLWHGIPLKKICYDDLNSAIHKMSPIVRAIYHFLRYKDSYYVVAGEYEKKVYKSAFLANNNQCIIIGSPRYDILFNNIKNAQVFMEEDFEIIKSYKTKGRKIFIYMPTFRDSGKDISGWLKIEKLKDFLKANNAILVCKLHPFDKNSLDFELPQEIFKMNSDSDIYPVLKYSDALITDYSSIYFDYLLLDKPILYYPIDLEEYQEKCRGFYRPYEELTAGIKAYNENELITAMQDVINGIDNYKEQRKVLRDKMFKYQDGKNCERVVEWIKSLDK